MPEPPAFEDVLDACIDDIVAGRSTVEECLDAWPQYRDLLAPLLRDVVVISVGEEREPEQPPDLWAELRARLEQTPQHTAQPEPLPVARVRPLGQRRIAALVAAGAAAIAAAVIGTVFRRRS